jgi:hypothetical protein
LGLRFCGLVVVRVVFERRGTKTTPQVRIPPAPQPKKAIKTAKLLTYASHMSTHSNWRWPGGRTSTFGAATGIIVATLRRGALPPLPRLLFFVCRVLCFACVSRERV